MDLAVLRPLERLGTVLPACHRGDSGSIPGQCILDFGGQRDTEAGLVACSSLSPYHYHSANAPYSYLIHYHRVHILSVTDSIVKQPAAHFSVMLQK